MIPLPIIIGLVLVAAAIIFVVGYYTFRSSDDIEEEEQSATFTPNRTGLHRMILPVSKTISGKHAYESTYRSVPSTSYFTGQQIGFESSPTRVPMGSRTIRDRMDSTFFRPCQACEAVLETN